MPRVAFMLVALAAVATTACPAHRPRDSTSPAAFETLSEDGYRHYLRGRLAAIAGDYSAAAKHFARAVNAEPLQAAMHVALADALYRAGKRQRAGQIIEYATQLFPDTSRVWSQCGRIRRGLGHAARAVQAYRRSLTLAPDNEQAYLGLASSLKAQGKLPEAEAAYLQLLARHSQSLTARLRLAQLLRAQKRYDTAEVHLREALVQHPHHRRVRLLLVETLAAGGNHTAAALLLREVFDGSGSSLAVAEDLLIELVDRKATATAVEFIHQLDRDDLAPSVRAAFGYMLIQLGHYSRAQTLAEHLSQSYPGTSLVQLLAARASFAAGHGEDATALLLGVPADDPGFLDCRLTATDMALQLGNIPDAERALEPITNLRPEPPTVSIMKARLVEARGQVDDARRQLENHLHRAGDDDNLRSVFLHARMSLEDRAGDRELAMDFAETILERDNDHLGALNYIGFTLADLGLELAKAEEHLHRAVELMPNNGHILDSLGWLQFRQGDISRALDTLKRAARIEPTEPEIFWHLSEVYRSTGQKSKADAMARKALALDPPEDLKRRILKGQGDQGK